MDEVTQQLSTFVEELRSVRSIPGLAVAITDRERTLLVETHGTANVETGQTLTPDHLFQIGSLTKGFTAVVALQLAAQGVLDLHAPVTDYLPWFEVQGGADQITTHHLLTHTAGLVTGALGFVDARSDVWALRRTCVGAPPGEWFHYSDVGFQAIGLIVTAAAGRLYRDVLAEQVLQPLGMSASEPYFPNSVRSRLATGYIPAFDDAPFVVGRSPLSPAPWFVGDGAAGGVCSKPEDMTAYLRLLLNRGVGPGGPLLSPEGFAAMSTPWIRCDGDTGDAYGYGIGMRSSGGRRLLHHSGGMVGYTTQLIADLDAAVGVIALTNGLFDVDIVARYALDLTVAARGGGPLPNAPSLRGPSDVDDADAFAGTFHGEAGTLAIDVSGSSLRLVDETGSRQLLRTDQAAMTFAIDPPGDDNAWIEFVRAGEGERQRAGGRGSHGEREGEVTEVLLGRHRFVRDRGRRHEGFGYPPEWDAFAGLYRAYNPWRPAVRFAVRKGALWMVDPVWARAEPLLPDGEATFRLARDSRLPERIRFHAFADGRPLRVEMQGCDHHRGLDVQSTWNRRPE